jgi:hypothetical protein
MSRVKTVTWVTYALGFALLAASGYGLAAGWGTDSAILAALASITFSCGVVGGRAGGRRAGCPTPAGKGSSSGPVAVGVGIAAGFAVLAGLYLGFAV